MPFPESPVAAAYIQGDLDHASGSQSAVTRIVMHCTVSPTVSGGARGNASYFQNPAAGGLAHYVVDPGEVVQCAPEGTVCWHAPPNGGSIGVELCDPQPRNPDGSDADPARWNDANHQSMLALAVKLVRDLATRWQVPLVFVDAAGLVAGRQGITGHAEVAQAWRQSDHTDPGEFPWTAFMAALNNTTPAAPAHQEDDEMLSCYRNTATGEIVTAGVGQWRHVESPAYYNLLVARGACKPAVDCLGPEFDYLKGVFLSEPVDAAILAELDKVAAAVHA
jgi:N-acetyl-anhydromuramyl-L-alanine amidase AmpD